MKECRSEGGLCVCFGVEGYRGTGRGLLKGGR